MEAPEITAAKIAAADMVKTFNELVIRRAKGNMTISIESVANSFGIMYESISKFVSDDIKDRP